MLVKQITFTVGMTMIEENTNYILLFDCYQSLLTDKQRQMMDLYYNQDFTLVEIAEELKISRQGVYDHLKRTSQLLEQYEKKMGILRTFQRQSSLIQKMKQTISNLELELLSDSDRESSLDYLKQLKISLEQLYQMSTT